MFIHKVSQTQTDRQTDKHRQTDRRTDYLVLCCGLRLFVKSFNECVKFLIKNRTFAGDGLGVVIFTAGSKLSHQLLHCTTQHTTHTHTQVNSALHPSGVAKSSTSFGWGKGGKVTSAGWQVTLCDLIWYVISRSGVVISITNCYIRLT